MRFNLSRELLLDRKFLIFGKRKIEMAYDPLHKDRRLWNEPENILKESLIGTAMLHRHLAYLESCQAIVRRDYDRLIGKVRIIGGGIVIDGPTYSGFVGPGMLTAAVFGLYNSASSVPKSEAILEVIKRLVTDSEPTSGVLLIVQDCTEYFINFSAARNKALALGIPTKLIQIRDELTDKLMQKPMSPRSPSGLLLMYKIAGAMAEEGRSLEEIYNLCYKTITSGVCFSIGVYLEEKSPVRPPEIIMCRGDRLSDREKKSLPLSNSTTKTLVEHVIEDLTNSDNYEKLPQGSQLALLFDYFGGLTELEANIVVKELIQQLNEFQYEIQVIYTGTFHTSIEIYGFHLSILNLSENSEFLYYLDAPTLAYSWPKSIEDKIDFQISREPSRAEKADEENEKKRKRSEDNGVPEIDVLSFEKEVLITAIDFACKALLSCAPKINMLDKSVISEEHDRCGSRLANVAQTVKLAIEQEKFASFSLSNIVHYVAQIFEQDTQDPQAELYAIFFGTIARVIKDHEFLEASDWFDAFVRSIHAVDNIIKGTKFSDTLYAAKAAFCDTFATDDDVNIIFALNQAVTAAQRQTSHVIADTENISENFDESSGFSGLAGAHALGVWMRGAYEGIKYKYSRQRTSRDKRIRQDDFEDEEIKTVSNSPETQGQYED